jgi:small subunit ribosomal protein S7
MGKKFKSFEKFVKPDHKFSSKLVSKFINSMMWEGKKNTSSRIFYQALDEMGKKITDASPLDIFNKAIDNVKPEIEVRSKRIGGATYQVPVSVSPKRQVSLALRWILQATRKKKGKPMHLRLADELAAAYKGEGEAILTKQNVHKMAEANKAFAHFAM